MSSLFSVWMLGLGLTCGFGQAAGKTPSAPEVSRTEEASVGGEGSPGREKTPAQTKGKKKTRQVPPWVLGVVPVVMTPPPVSSLESQFRKEVREGLKLAGQLTVVDSRVESVRLRFPLIDNCTAGSCLSSIAQALGADLLVRLKIKRTGKNYTLALHAMDPKKRVETELKGRCDICTLSEARDSVKKLAAKLGTLLRQKRAALSPPPVPLGGECVGERKCMKGMVCHKGRCIWEREIPRKQPPRKKGVSRPEDRPLARRKKKKKPKITITKKKKPPRKHPWGQFAWVTGGVGALSLIVGGALLAVDEKPSCDRPHGKTTCGQRYDTKAAGGVLTAVGVLGGAASVFFTYLWWKNRNKESNQKKQKKVQVSVVPWQSGVAASATVRF